jgi:predicted nuclease of restriction endonuclease-like (RecB) superfamily
MLLNNSEYFSVLNEIKSRIKVTQHNILSHANTRAIALYWHIGRTINEHASWGNKFVTNLSRDIKYDFPDAQGYSVRNLKYMAKFATTWPDIKIMQRSVAQLPWRHNITLMEKLKDQKQRLWYAKETVINSWSRDILVHQIETNLYARQATVQKVSNYNKRLQKPQNYLAVQAMKDPYVFDFIPIEKSTIERDIENELVKNITKFLLELGTGFAFIGHQYHLEVGGKDFYIDLLFYNLVLRCYVVIELKTGDFEPEHAGKLNFYLSAVDAKLKSPEDNPSIGILLCKTKENIIAEYALKDIKKPVGVSEYKILEKIPKQYKKALPSIDDIKNRIK